MARSTKVDVLAVCDAGHSLALEARGTGDCGMITRLYSRAVCRLGMHILFPVTVMFCFTAIREPGHAAWASDRVAQGIGSESKPPAARNRAGSKKPNRKRGRGANRAKPGKRQLDPTIEEQVREALGSDQQSDDAESAKLADDRGNPRNKKQRRPPRTSRRAPQRHRVDAKSPPTDADAGEGATTVTPGNMPGESTSTATINVPAVDSDVPPEERTYSFSIKDGTYEQLIDVVSRLTGLGVLGETPKGGKVSFVADEELTFDELLGRVRMLLFRYKPHEPYWLLREDTHLEVIRVNDIYRIMPRDRMYRSVAEFGEAILPDHELALVKYTPAAGSVADLSVVRDFMPDYVRVTPMEDENTVIIFGLVSDIKKYLWLTDFFVSGGGGDPRLLEKIPVEHITPTEAVEQLGQLMDLGPSAPLMARKVNVPRGRSSAASPLASIPEPEVSVLPADAQHVIIVRAMRSKIEEIKRLLPLIDVATEIIYAPVVIEVKHAHPEELVTSIQQILSASPSAVSTPQPIKRKRPSRARGKRVGQTASAVTAQDITLMAHPTQSAIIVLGDDEGVARVKEYVAMFDVPTDVQHVPIELENVSAQEIIPTLTELLKSTPGTPKTRSTEPQLVSDLSGTLIWYSGPEANLRTIREMVALMDSAEEVPSLHIVRLVNLRPSFVAGVLQDYISGAGAGAGGTATPKRTPPRRRGKKGGRSWPGGTSRVAASGTRNIKITPDDERSQLLVLCGDADWEELRPIIEQLEEAAPKPEFVRVAVENIAPTAAIAKVSALLGLDAKHAKGEGMRFEATEDAILVMGASERELETIRELLTQFDRALEIEQRTFLIRHGNPGDIASAIRALVGGGGGGAVPSRPGRGGVASRGAKAHAQAGSDAGDLTIVVMGDRITVQAPPALMEDVASLIEEFDVEERTSEIRVYDDFPPGTDIEEISATLSSMFGQGKRPARGARRGGEAKPAASTGPEFLPRPAARKLVVVAEPEMFGEIEELLDVLRIKVEVPTYELAFIDVQNADPEELIEQIDPLLTLAVEQMVRSGRLTGVGEAVILPAPSGPAVQGKAKARRGRTQQQVTTEEKRYYLEADTHNRRIVISAPAIVIAEARKLVSQFDLPATDDEIVVTVVEVKYADPEQLVATIEPLLALRVEQLHRSGRLKGGTVQPTVPSRRRGARQKTPGRPDRDSSLYHLTPDPPNHRIVIASPQVIADEVAELIAEFDRPVASDEPIEVVFVDVQYVDPEAIVDAVEALLDVKISDMIRRGELPEAGAPAQTTPKQKRGRAPEARRSGKPYHLEPDVRNRRIAVAAPRTILNEAVQLITQFDKPGGDTTDFRTIALTNSTAEAMVQAIKELVGQPVRSVLARRGKGGAAAPATAPEQFKIVEAPGGGAVVLSGPKADVEQAAGWVERLDGQKVGGRVIKIFEIENADVSQLVDLIMADVDTTPTPGKPVRRLPATRARRPEPEAEEEEEFQVFKTRVGTDVYLQANLIESTLVVSASRAKMARIEEIVARVDSKDDPVIPTAVIPKFEYELSYADPFDAALDLEAVIEVLGDFDETPRVDYTSIGDLNLLIVKHPKGEEVFPRIREWIAKYVDKEPEGGGLRQKVVPPPANVSPTQMALWFQMHHPDLDIEIVDITPREEQAYDVEELKPSGSAVESPCILPTALGRFANGILSDAVGQVEPEEDAPEDREDQEVVERGTAAEEPVVEESDATSDDLLRNAGRSLADQTPADEGGGPKEARQGRRSNTRSKQVKVKVDRQKGVLIIEGPPSAVEDLTESIDDLEEETKDLPSAPPDIRIYRVKFIDVFSATNIINEMFNMTHQQRQQLQRQQQQAARLALQQQRAQQRQQKGQEAQQGRADARVRQQQQFTVAQVPAPAVRVYPNPRDRSLILRAEANQYPALLRLLATIDQPKPIDSRHRIYPLRKLNAVEVEDLLNDWLGLTEVTSRPKVRTRQRGARRTAPTPTATEAAGQLPETIMEMTKTGAELGVDPKDIKLSSNAETNTILVMAPEAALDYIGQLIHELENQDVPDRIWKDYELKYADVDRLAEYLTTRYEGQSSGPQRRGSAGGRGRGRGEVRSQSGPRSSKP
ncbi:MAG: secretin N-terminal domain-containing protein, partial [Phycisphaerae bacterium]